MSTVLSPSPSACGSSHVFLLLLRPLGCLLACLFHVLALVPVPVLFFSSLLPFLSCIRVSFSSFFSFLCSLLHLLFLLLSLLPLSLVPLSYHSLLFSPTISWWILPSSLPPSLTYFKYLSSPNGVSDTLLGIGDTNQTTVFKRPILAELALYQNINMLDGDRCSGRTL